MAGAAYDHGRHTVARRGGLFCFETAAFFAEAP
jgi:hypothetical protein